MALSERHETYRLIDLIVLHKQHSVALATDTALKLLEDELLADDDLLCAVLIAVCTGLSFLLWVEYHSKLGWLERPVDEL